MSATGQHQSACVANGQIFCSTDFGNTWTPRAIVRNWTSISISASGLHQIAVVSDNISTGGMYASSDYGNTWSQVYSANYLWKSVSVSSSGQYISACGDNSVYISNTGIYSTINGYPIANTNPQNSNMVLGSTLTSNTTGANNTALGFESLNSNSTGNNNTALGYQAGNNITTGSNNMCLGNSSTASISTASNEITLGNSNITALRCQVQSISSLSDARDKKNINPLPVGLEFISDLNPVEFDWNMRDGGKVDIHEFGFIAQELKASQEKLGITVPNLVYESNPEKLEASYGALLPIMVKATKELKTTIDYLMSEIEMLKSEIAILKQR
jgi:hypothetical protein